MPHCENPGSGKMEMSCSTFSTEMFLKKIQRIIIIKIIIMILIIRKIMLVTIIAIIIILLI
mgnify:CR=1 FL=1